MIRATASVRSTSGPGIDHHQPGYGNTKIRRFALFELDDPINVRMTASLIFIPASQQTRLQFYRKFG